MSGVLAGSGLIAGIIALGYLLARRGTLGEPAGLVLTRLAFTVATPALLFDALVDADLSVLAAPRAAYVAYVRDVRRELAHLPDGAWRRGRTDVLRGLLAAPRLFTTPPLQHQEQRARANMAAELASLA